MSEDVKIGIIMGSNSDWPTMQAAARVLEDFGVAYEARVVSAHRTPDLMFEYACHEGNYAVPNALSGQRVVDARGGATQEQ